MHATLADTALGCYEELVGELSPAEAETYYQEMARVAEVFGVGREHQPATLAEFRTYMDETVAALEVTPVGRDLAAFILDPSLPLGLHVPLAPLLHLQRLFTLGSLPASLRDQLDVTWDDSDEERYRRAQRRVRLVFRLVPPTLRTAGSRLNGQVLLWQARRRVAAFEATLRSAADGQVAA